MKKNVRMISVVTLLALLGMESVCANSTVWLSENATSEYGPMAAAGEEDAPVTGADGKPVASEPFETHIKRQNDNGSDGKPDVRKDKPMRFGVGYEYRMRRNGRANRPERVQRPDRPRRPDRPGR